MNYTVIIHQHTPKAAMGKASNRWEIVCTSCHRVLIKGLSSEGARTMVKIMTQKCVVPGCDNPVYVNEDGLAGQKPYKAALCVDHLYKNFAAIGILPPMIGKEVKRDDLN